MLVVSTFLWRDPTRDNRGYILTPDHVRILKNMVERNLTIPHKFICVTDEDLNHLDIETVPLNWEKHVPGTVFMRLLQHNEEWARANLGERILSFDIDIVITSNIDHIASRDEPIVLWHNPNFPKPGRAFYQSSVQLFTPGARPQLWADFDPIETPKWVNWRFGGREQAWISECLEWNEAWWDDRHGIYGAGRLVRGEKGKGVYTDLPENACIVSFPGAREPSQPEVQKLHPWIGDFYH